MKRIVTALAAVAAFGMLVSAANAQEWFRTSQAKPNTVKLGIFMPSNGDVKDATKDVWFNAAIERVIADVPDSASDITCELGYMRAKGDGDYKLRNIPLTLNWRVHAPQSMAGGSSLYYGLGAGPNFIRAEDGSSDSLVKLGGAAFVGIENKDWMCELKYNYVKAWDKNVGGLIATVGYRF